MQEIPFAMHEAEMSRQERTQKRLFTIILILIILLVGSNAAWLWYESQFEDVVTSQEVMQEADGGNNNFVGGDIIGYTES